MPITISYEELLEALDPTNVGMAEEGMTAHDWCKIWKRSEQAVYRKLRLAMECGLMEVGWSRRKSINGRWYRVPVYKLVKREKN